MLLIHPCRRRDNILHGLSEDWDFSRVRDKAVEWKAGGGIDKGIFGSVSQFAILLRLKKGWKFIVHGLRIEIFVR